ncbi:MAG TPA: tRNA lysidine(34) synthetase TilS, partial [Rhodothermales bacterium]|nr:tRNA lysidine(34) synthetase TilS [Rhodothermales bacterium]
PKAHAEAHQKSLQEAARDIRYAYFLRLAEVEAISQVAVAHHLDDQVETVLLHLVRGAGPEGLAGMPASRLLNPQSAVRLVRPLLDCWREDIEAYAQMQDLQWREDASNTDPSYRRNMVRSDIIPLLEKHFGPSVSKNIARSAHLLRGYVEDTLRADLAQHFERAAQAQPKGGQLDLTYLQSLPDVWRGRVILEACNRWLPIAPRTKAFVDEVDALLEAQVGSRVVLEGGSIWRERTHMRWVHDEAREVDLEATYSLEPEDQLTLPDGILRLEELEERPVSLKTVTPCTVIMDADALSQPLTVRPWRPGDRLQPFGMEGTKRVSDVLTDAKVPSHRRDRVWVVLSGEVIVWVVGVRMAESVRVRPETVRFVKITYKPHRLTEE